MEENHLRYWVLEKESAERFPWLAMLVKEINGDGNCI